MADLSDPKLNDSERDIADVVGLFADESASAPLPKTSAVPKTSGSSIETDSYELLEDEEPRSAPVLAPRTPPAPAVPRPKPKAKSQPVIAKTRTREDDIADASEEDGEDEIDFDGDADASASADSSRTLSHSDPEDIVPWSRVAEWRFSLVVLGAAALIVAWLVWHFLAEMAIGSAFLAVIGGLIALGGLSYPILITLEPPIRMTPEQALRDFCDALSHGRPHYRRMWLLLTPRGQARNRGFGDFKRHWSKRLETLGGSKTKSWSNLEFTVAEFRLKKSKDQTTATAKYEIHASNEAQGFLGRLKGRIALTKGTDRMWYLEDGRL